MNSHLFCNKKDTVQAYFLEKYLRKTSMWIVNSHILTSSREQSSDQNYISGFFDKKIGKLNFPDKYVTCNKLQKATLPLKPCFWQQLKKKVIHEYS